MKQKGAALAAVVLALIICLNSSYGLAKTPTFFRHLGNDIRYTFGYWPAFTIIGGAIGSAELAAYADQDVADHFRGGSHLGKFDTVAKYIGEFYVVDTSSVIVYGIGKLVHNEKVAYTGETLFEALLLTETSTLGLKFAFNRERPNGGNYGFPSGHASRTFAAATVLEVMHGPAFGIPAYLAAAAISFSRIDSNAHNVSDVVFGAAWGAAIGWGTAWYHNKEWDKKWAVIPTSGYGPGLTFEYIF